MHEMDKNIVSIDNISVPTAEKLLAMQPQLAEKAFNSLSLERKAELVLSVPWQRRMEIIQLAGDAPSLVKALPEEEIYWTAKERGIEDSLSLISMTSHEQFQYLIDIDCWNKDRLDIKSMMTWYRLLGRCNEGKVAEWFCKADDELLIHSLKKLFKLFKIEEEKDISEEYADMPDHTIDGIYYFHFIDAGNALYILPLLNLLYQYNRSRFYSLVEGVLWDTETETEDEAFRWRQSRIADKGFPELDEALSVYQYMSDTEIIALRRDYSSSDGAQIGASEAGDAIIPRYRYIFSMWKTTSFLFRVLQSVANNEFIERMQREILTIANKIIIADGYEVKDRSAVVRSLHKALGFVNTGLEILSGHELPRARSILAHAHVAELFRVGFSHVIRMRQRFQQRPSKLWVKDRARFKTFFDSPWAEAVIGIMMERPLFYEGLAVHTSLEYRDFGSHDEVQLAEHALETVIAADHILFDLCMIDVDYLMADYVETTSLHDAGELKCSAIFLTSIANQILHLRTGPMALTSAELTDFLLRVFQQSEKGSNYSIKPEVRNDIIAWITGWGRSDSALITGLDAFVDTCLHTLEEEFAQLIGRDMDPKYVTSILLKKRA